MGTPHPILPSSIAHYRCNETKHGTYGRATDSGQTGRDLDNAEGSELHHVVNGPSGKQFAKHFNGSNHLNSSSTPGGSERAVFTTSPTWTVMAWVNPDNLSGASHYIFAVGGNGDAGDATNTIVALAVNTSGRPFSFFEVSGGIDVVAQPGGVNHVVTGQDQHIAVTRNGDTWKFYVDGVQVGSDAIEAQLPVGGSSGRIIAANSRFDASFGNGWEGSIYEIHVLDVVLNDAAILAAFQAEGDTPGANSLYYYAMNETPDLIDSHSGGYHLRANMSGGVITAPLVNDGGSARAVQVGILYEHFARAELLARFKTDFTWVGWVRHEDIKGFRGYWIYGDPGPETSAENFFGVEVTGGGDLTVFSESGAGVDASFTTSGAGIQDLTRHHLALVVTYSGATYVAEFYVDGALVGTSGSLTAYDGGTDAFLRLLTGPAENSMEGAADEFAFYAEALDAAAILKFYEDGINDGQPVPSIPAPSPLESPDGGIQFSLRTDDARLVT